MVENNKFYFIHCMSPVHIGTGQGVGVIDMPMIRERITGWPFIPGSSMKGVTREYYKSTQEAPWLEAAFGRAKGKGEDEGNAGALVLSDSRLLAFPVASMHGTFAYVSCPMVLKRLARDAEAANIQLPSLEISELEASLDGETVLVGNKQETKIIGNKQETKISRDGKVEIDEFSFGCKEAAALDEWIKSLADQIFTSSLSKEMFIKRFVLVSDEAFQYFVTLCCDLIPRIRIDSNTMAVEDGALWTEEYLPAESILYGIMWCDQVYAANSKVSPQQILDKFNDELLLQVGGNATVGKGRVRCSFSKGEIQ